MSPPSYATPAASRPRFASAGAAVRPTLSSMTAASTVDPSASSTTCSPPCPTRALMCSARAVARLDIARIAVGANDDPPRPRDLRVAADRHGPRGLVPLDVSGVIGIVAALADDHVVAPRRCSLPGIVTAAGADLRRVQQRLRWHAAPEGARAAEEIALDERDRCATGARVTRRGFARGAGADNREVEPFGHARSA